MAARSRRYRVAADGPGRWARLVTGRRGAWAVLVGAVLLLGLTAPAFRTLSKHEDNAETTFLPAGAPSTRVLAFEEAHPSAGENQAVVVLGDPRGLGAAGQAAARALRAALVTHPLPGTEAPGPLRLAPNGRVAVLDVPVSVRASTTTVDRVVADLGRLARHQVATHRARGVQVAIGGAPAAEADVAHAFAGVDGRLLGVTVAIVVVLLLLTYRSPVLWLLPLVSVLVAASWAEGIAATLAAHGFVVNGMTVGILTVVVFGAGTDYALLLVARVREELTRRADHREAVAEALRRTGPTVLASGATVTLALLCLLVARLKDVAALGPACAAGVVCALVAQLLVLPALLAVCGRRVFWPKVPALVADAAARGSGAGGSGASPTWRRLAEAVVRRPALIGGGTAVVLALCCLGLLGYRGGVNQVNGFRQRVGAVVAQGLLDEGFPPGESAPAIVLVRPADHLGAARAAARSTPGVVEVGPATTVDGAALFPVVLAGNPAGRAAERSVALLRQRVAQAAGPRTLVGGETATDLDLHAAAVHDTEHIVPLILLVVLIILGLLLRSVVAPVVLTSSVLLTYLAALGVSSLAVVHLFGFPGFDATVPIFGFVFLVALGVDYTVFLASRTREEAGRLGTSAGVVRALAATGPVISAAGVVLAATFAALGVLPLVALTELGFLVAFGVLLDTLVVRSLVVPAVVSALGERFWWPGRPGPGPGSEH
jgi:RND superfamily putative drug exporter